MESFRLFLDDFSDAATNMALDETLLQEQCKKDSIPSIRLYRWKPPALSVGYLQRIRDEVDLDICRKLGIDYVRRLTGGKAVLHDDELTYSIIIPSSHKKMEGIGVVDSYRTISKALVRSLQLCGIMCEIAPKIVPSQARMGSKICFETPSTYEVMAGNKKIIGSAQTRDKGVILQHGSVPIDWDTEKMLDVMGIPIKGRKVYRERFNEKATSISKELGHRIEFEDLIHCFVKGFEDTFKVDLIPSEYTKDEKNIASNLATEKYASDNWNLRK
ncbi:MAG: lipoate--protein ligase family protein [Candidatus Thermoplasmatota archaeon]|jgi:lipoate-protein ligase A|nr:lipoate--protein ligase family protein [Candidatus Thermoplasmatota archaeon]